MTITRTSLIMCLLSALEHHVIEHPPPWHVASGFSTPSGMAVVDSRGAVAMMASSQKEAALLIKLAGYIEDDLQGFRKKLAAALTLSDEDFTKHVEALLA